MDACNNVMKLAIRKLAVPRGICSPGLGLRRAIQVLLEVLGG
jgi:hypothetical protein